VNNLYVVNNIAVTADSFGVVNLAIQVALLAEPQLCYKRYVVL
jgi:hypothetical protein